MDKKRLVIWILAFILIIFSTVLYFKENNYWYNYLVLGMLLLFDNLSHLRKNKTTLDLLFDKQYKKFLNLFLALFVLGLLMELIGHFWLNLWHYSYINPPREHILSNIIGFLMYPLTLMSFREIFNFVCSFAKNNIASVIVSMLFGIIILEIPNSYSKDWIYTIPYISLEIFGVNILVLIFGWLILIISPLLVYKLLNISS